VIVEAAPMVPTPDHGLPHFSLGFGAGFPQVLMLSGSYWLGPQFTLDADVGGIIVPDGHLAGGTGRFTFHVGKSPWEPRSALLLTIGGGAVDATVLEDRAGGEFALFGVGYGWVGEQWDLRGYVWGATSQAEQIFVTLSAQYIFRRELTH
jgi:hypothetical protein